MKKYAHSIHIGTIESVLLYVLVVMQIIKFVVISQNMYFLKLSFLYKLFVNISLIFFNFFFFLPLFISMYSKVYLEVDS